MWMEEFTKYFIITAPETYVAMTAMQNPMPSEHLHPISTLSVWDISYQLCICVRGYPLLYHFYSIFPDHFFPWNNAWIICLNIQTGIQLYIMDNSITEVNNLMIPEAKHHQTLFLQHSWHRAHLYCLDRSYCWLASPYPASGFKYRRKSIFKTGE